MATAKQQELLELKARLRLGGGEKAIEKQHGNGKQTARERLVKLFDEDSFVETGLFVKHRCQNFGMDKKEAPGEGVVTGYGTIDGRLVYAAAQDFTVIGGSLGEMHAAKIAMAQEAALKAGAPMICINDSGGARIQEGVDALAGYGRIFYNNTMASGVIPQITAVFGNCGGGLALIPTLTDFTFMEASKAKLFVNSPNALDGNNVSKCDSASAAFQSSESGIVDVVADEAAIYAKVRELVSMLPGNNEDDASYEECTDDLNRVCADLANCVGDTSIALSTIADNNVFFEVKENYAKDMVTGFIKLNGMTVGCVANRTEVYSAEGEVTDKYDAVLSADGCEKAADLITFCDAFDIPVLSLTNVKGYEATVCSEKRIAKAVAKLTYAFANATVPKVNVVIGKALGSAYIAMNSKSIGADLTIAWQDAQIGSMDANLAAKIMYEGQGADVISEKAAEYAALQTSAAGAARRGYVDQIIDAADTRKYVIGAFEMLFTKREDRPSKKHGTV